MKNESDYSTNLAELDLISNVKINLIKNLSYKISQLLMN